MLDTALAGMLCEEGKSVLEAAQVWAQSMSITARVKRQYASRLGGNWTLDGLGPIAQWRRCILDVRNGVLHAGRFPTSREVKLAGDAVPVINSFLTGRLVANWREYPKTMAVLAGPTTVRQHAPRGQTPAVLAALDSASASRRGFTRCAMSGWQSASINSADVFDGRTRTKALLPAGQRLTHEGSDTDCHGRRRHAASSGAELTRQRRCAVRQSESASRTVEQRPARRRIATTRRVGDLGRTPIFDACDRVLTGGGTATYH